MKSGAENRPEEGISSLFQYYCRYGTTVNGLLAVAGITSDGVCNPCFIVSEFKYLRTKLGAQPATDTEVHINFRSSHRYYHPFLNISLLILGSNNVRIQLCPFVIKQLTPTLSLWFQDHLYTTSATISMIFLMAVLLLDIFRPRNIFFTN